MLFSFEIILCFHKQPACSSLFSQPDENAFKVRNRTLNFTVGRTWDPSPQTTGRVFVDDGLGCTKENWIAWTPDLTV